MTDHSLPAARTHYYVPGASHYSVLLSVSIFFLAAGFILRINEVPQGLWGMVLGALGILYVLVGWFGELIGENLRGIYTRWEDRSYRIGMVWFIFSEVMFFSCFFGALFYLRRIALPELGSYSADLTPYSGFTGAWPSSGPLGNAFTPMAAWGVPAINTLLLLTSGATLTWAHFGLLKNKRAQLNIGLALTVALGLSFMVLQAAEYMHAYDELGLTLGAGVYGATFFILTGFHGLHVTLGSIMLLVMLGRGLSGHFSSKDHFAFEAVAWYWHFVDVVWLLLFIFVYWL
ncbi:MAG: cytochrome c oxidase subunit 3 [Burkholderiales bacterium]|nr:cytochrome c oxidase subunit 3 [Burkholderiales bacterium]MDE2398226.1 cytochrome c oxidase subunit 3 [Burkholderiales bacterium]MDE2456896.1 cytochrome c oxidase subunit 3 [Burkholderiales bacterium]